MAQTTTASRPTSRSQSDVALFALLMAVVAAVRLGVVGLTDLELGPEEAQYWTWSLEPAFGYYSKPPLIAWLIAATTSVCGAGDVCIRFPASLIHIATSGTLFVLGRDMFGPRVGFWTGLAHASIPGVWYSSAFMTTDVPLLFFWSLALLALWRFLATGALIWAAVLGIAIGLGALSKYAMLYFLLCLAVFAVAAPAHVARSTAGGWALAGVIALALFAPNIAWNVGNGFITLTHTAENVPSGERLFNPSHLLDFVGAQLGVFGPLLFIALVRGSVSVIRKARVLGSAAREDIFLLSFSLPVLGLMTALSLAFNANANWAAPAYMAGCVFVVAWWLREDYARWMFASLALNAVFVMALIGIALSPALADLTLPNKSLNKVRGWADVADHVERTATSGDYDVILFDHRPTIAELSYHARDLDVPFKMWDGDGIAQSHYELTAPLDLDFDGVALLVANETPPSEILSHFDNQRFIETLTVELRAGESHVFWLYRLEGDDGH